MYRASLLAAALGLAAGPALADCAAELRDFNWEYEDHAAHMTYMNADNFRKEIASMRTRAQTMMADGNTERCEAIVEEMRAMLESQHVAYRDFLESDRMSVGEMAERRVESARPFSKVAGGERAKLDALMDADVYLMNRETIGVVDDFVIDEQSGKVTHVIVAVGGWLDFTDTIKAVSLEDALVTRDMDALVLDMIEVELAKTPIYREGQVDLENR